MEEASELNRKEIVQRTIKSLHGLGNQKFALSPFSSYFDDWLINLRKVLSVFESNPLIGADNDFIKERCRILDRVERELSGKRLDESILKEKTKALSDKNHLLEDTDAVYAAETREIRRKRNSEIEDLTRAISDLEKQFEEISDMKTSFFGGFSKKAKAQKQAEITDRLATTKKELEAAIQNFALEQEKLHDEYEKRKTATITEVQILEKEIEEHEIDNSQPYRQSACESLIEAINMFLGRKTQTS
ncbi:TPA: hypothetical protein HA273_00875 [Candidatus Bathyarchaeota archaeon]|nr:hypothetical protein [Candidatus Bathyarchaeota archaeon]